MIGLSTRFALIVEGLCRMIAERGAKDRALAPLLLFVWGALRRMAARFEALVARIQTGRLRPFVPDPAARRRSPPTLRPPHRLPRGFAWLIRLVPVTAAAYRSQLEHLLADPAMAKLLAAAPGAGAILRPLCRILGIAPGPGSVPPPRSGRRQPAHAASPGEPPPDKPSVDPVLAIRFART